jgi:hypothetical protein
MPYSMRGLKYVSMNKGVLSMPMLVVENSSVLEMRDCMVRSSRSTDGQGMHGGGDDRSEWTLKDRSNSFVDEKRERDSLSGRRNSLSSGDLEDIAIWINGESLSDSCQKGINQSFTGIGLFTSVIFHNFHVVTRCGINSTLSL